MSEWTKFTDKWPPLDMPINTRFELRDEVPQKPWIMRYLPKKQPLKCEYKFEVIDKGKKTLIGVYEDIIDHMEWKLASEPANDGGFHFSPVPVDSQPQQPVAPVKPYPDEQDACRSLSAFLADQIHFALNILENP